MTNNTSAVDRARERALKLAERLAKIAPGSDEGLLLRVTQIRDRLKTPMADVLAKVPGESVTEKCKKIGITRQNYYAWLKGAYRPNRRQARKLAQLTGVAVEAIRPTAA